ncbi:MAG: adenosylcobinamide-GDP ribazoletransferase [Marinosulfonomonas sp.]|nr:MAG: adenosylcobinamide-GDP ribazoletransferase [Marinosulfonomonas sp.]
MANRDTARLQPGDIVESIALLTRLPVNSNGERGIHAAWAWPLAGALVGLLSGIIALIAISIDLPSGLAAGIAIAAQIILTGAMHEDGLADCADGFWGGWDKERRLEIMKDSAIGTYGTLALILSVLLRWILLSTLFETGSVIGPLIGAAVLSRVPMAALMFYLLPARGEGLSASTGRPSVETFVLNITVALLIALFFIGFLTLPALLAVAGLTWGVAKITLAKIGGQTGDVLGASQQIAEIGVLTTIFLLAG